MQNRQPTTSNSPEISPGSGSSRAERIASPQAEENPQPNLQGVEISPRLWFAILATGLGAGLAGGMLMRLLRLVQHLCFHYVSGDFLTGVEGVSGVRRLVVVTCAGVLTSIALLLVRRIPDRNGPGLNEAIWKDDGLLPPRSMSARAVLSVVIVGMGAALGREAALKDGGGIVGLRVSRWFGLSPQQRKLLVACGVGAGMSAAYNVPLGGALFILEVLLGTVSVATAIAAFTTCFIATAVSWLLLPNEPTYQIPYLPVNLSLCIFALVSGPVMGIGAVLFVRGLHWAKNNKPRGVMAVILPVLVFAVLGAAAMQWPAMLGNGKNVIQLAFDSRLAGPVLFVLLVLRPLATIACLRAGAPGGLFTPIMTLGAMLGAAMGEGWNHLWAGADKRSCALLGAGAVLAAATQAPISSVAFALELTYSMSSLIVPLLLAVSGAVLAYRGLESRTSY
jgi:CIC family chloride channel protein